MNIQKEKLVLSIFVFSILMVIVLSFFAFSFNLTGRVIDEAGAGQQIQTCSDSDGKNYNVKGTLEYCTNGNCLTERDSCSGKKVVEFYCENNEKKSEEKECSYDCDDGICIESAGDYKLAGTGGGIVGSSSGSTTTTTATAVSGETYDLGSLTSEQTLEIVKNDNVKFKISGTEYSLNLKDNSETQATIVHNAGIEIINVGEKKEIDLNSDGTKDIYLKVKTISVVSGKVKLILNLF